MGVWDTGNTGKTQWALRGSDIQEVMGSYFRKLQWKLTARSYGRMMEAEDGRWKSPMYVAECAVLTVLA